MSINATAGTYTEPNGMVYTWSGSGTQNCTIAHCPVQLSVYGYRASLPLSALLIALYAIVAILQVGLAWKYRTWGFMSAMILGCIDEIIGYVGRIIMYQNPWNNSGFIMQIVLITIGPVFFSAAIYVELYQIVNYLSRKSSRFNPVYFYYIFIPCDIISLILQAVGGAMSSTSNGGSTSGVDIALAGLGFQVATLAIFIALSVDYFIRSRQVWLHNNLSIKFKSFIFFTFLAAILILIRCCYRVYELQGGYQRDSSALRDQPLFIGLEAVMVILAAFCLVIGHPGPVFYAGEKGPGAMEWETREGEKGNAGESMK